MPRLTPIAALCLATLFPALTPGQEPDRRFEGRVEVSEVLFDVVVTDKKGNIVTGLEAGDFIIKAEGRTVEPTSVAFYTTRYADEGAADQIPASRYFIFFFHDQRRAGRHV